MPRLDCRDIAEPEGVANPIRSSFAAREGAVLASGASIPTRHSFLRNVTLKAPRGLPLRAMACVLDAVIVRFPRLRRGVTVQDRIVLNNQRLATAIKTTRKQP